MSAVRCSSVLYLCFCWLSLCLAWVGREAATWQNEILSQYGSLYWPCHFFSILCIPSADSQWGSEEVLQWNLQKIKIQNKKQGKPSKYNKIILKPLHCLAACHLGNQFALWRFSEIRFLFQTHCWLQGSLQRRHIPSLGKLSSFNMQPELDKAKAGALHWRNGVGVDDDLCLEWLFFF